MFCEDCEYPIVLSFTCPVTGVTLAKVMNDEGQAEDVFNWFFSGWGYDVPYSVDGLTEYACNLKKHAV